MMGDITSAVILYQTASVANYFARACGVTARINVCKSTEVPIRLHHLVRLANVVNPDVFFVEVNAAGRAVVNASEVQAASPDAQVIGFCEGAAQRNGLSGNPGFRATLMAPFDPTEITMIIDRMIVAGRADRKEVIAFQPARGGSGATTLALNTARALASRSDSGRVLLIDLDFAARTLSAVLDSPPHTCVSDLLKGEGSSEQIPWQQSVLTCGGLDCLLAARSSQGVPLSSWNLRRLLAAVLPEYDAVVIDLPVGTNDLTEAALGAASQVCLACTPDRATLVITRRRLRELKGLGVRRDKLTVVLNQYLAKTDEVNEAGSILGTTPYAGLPLDVPAMRRANATGGFVDHVPPFRNACAELVAHLQGEAALQPSLQTRRFEHSSLKNLFARLWTGEPTN